MKKPHTNGMSASWQQLSDTRERLSLVGTLRAADLAEQWEPLCSACRASNAAITEVDLAGVSYCDNAGLALLLQLRSIAHLGGRELTYTHVPAPVQALLDQFPPEVIERPLPRPPQHGFVESVGATSARVLDDMRMLVTYFGEFLVESLAAVRNPRLVRWKDAWVVFERAGVNALPIILLLGFLVGVILSFQSLIPMRMFGAEIFVANLVGISIVRELGPLFTAIILAGRSGSAFAAEIGTMKVNEEIDALQTMGLSPMRFLVLSRVLAAVAVTPILTVFMNIAGLLGGMVVMNAVGFSSTIYWNQVREAVMDTDYYGGLFKSLFFGLLIALVGCIRGLQTGEGASAVGESTTSSVVSSIVLIIAVDGVFAVIFYLMEW